MGSCRHLFGGAESRVLPYRLPVTGAGGTGGAVTRGAGQEGQEGKKLVCRAWQVTVMCLTDHKHAGLVTWMGWGWFRGG